MKSAKVQRLAQLAVELRAGRDFPITRLTVLKRLCQDPSAAAHFAVFLTRRAGKRMKPSKFKPLVSEAVKKTAAAVRRSAVPVGFQPHRRDDDP